MKQISIDYKPTNKNNPKLINTLPYNNMHEKVINLNANSMSNSFLIDVLTNVTDYYHSNSP